MNNQTIEIGLLNRAIPYSDHDFNDEDGNIFVGTDSLRRYHTGDAYLNLAISVSIFKTMSTDIALDSFQIIGMLEGELLFDICRTGIALSLDAVSAACSQPRPSTERLQCLAESVLEVIFEYQKFIVVYTREEKNLRPEEAREIREQRKLFDHQLAELLREGDQTGEFQVSDPLLTANTIGGVVTWVSLWYSPDGKRSKLEILTHVLEMVFTIVASKKAFRPLGGSVGQLGNVPSIRSISPVGGKHDER